MTVSLERVAPNLLEIRGFEVVFAFLAWERIADLTDGAPQGLIGSCGSFSDELLSHAEENPSTGRREARPVARHQVPWRARVR